MFSIKRLNLAALLLVLVFTSTALSQQPQSTPQTQPATGEAIPRSVYKNRVFEIKHRDPDTLLSVIRLLGSGTGAMSVSKELRTITVRDFPENIATIEEAIKRLDVPGPPQPDIEYRVHILIATNTVIASMNQYPPELKDVIKQLQETLSYKNYFLMTSAIHRSKAGPAGIANKGVADFKLNTESAARNSPIFYDYMGSLVTLENTASGAPTVQISIFKFNMRIPIETSSGTIQYDSVGFSSPVNVREGEKVVVGTTTMQDKGIIIVLSAKVIR